MWAYTTSNRDQGRDLSALFPGREYADLVGCSVYDDDVTLLLTLQQHVAPARKAGRRGVQVGSAAPLC